MNDLSQKPPRRFDLNKYLEDVKAELPPAGRHSAKIVHTDYSEKSDVTWLFVDWEIEDYGTPVRQILAIDEPETSAESPNLNRKRQVAQGLTQLIRIAAAAKADLQNDIGCYADFAMLIGTQAEIIIGHNNRDGVPQALVKTVM